MRGEESKTNKKQMLSTVGKKNMQLSDRIEIYLESYGTHMTKWFTPSGKVIEMVQKKKHLKWVF